MNIAIACRDRGHSVEFFTGEWEGEKPGWAPVHMVPVQGVTNHSRGKSFAAALHEMLEGQDFDGTVGFNRMPGLDVYYAADVCFMEKSHQRYGSWYRLTPRYRHYVEFEKAIYGTESKTQILLVAEAEKGNFIKNYGTKESRFHLLPPGISQSCMAGEDAGSLRVEKRKELDLPGDHYALFLIGSGFRTKGLDRAIEMLSLLPDGLKGKCRLFVVGQDDFSEYGKIAGQKGLANQVVYLGGRPDVPGLLQAADALVHPAYSENTGNVILEAIVSGLPVLATDICGYAHYIDEADAGIVHRTPWDSKRAASELEILLCSEERGRWRENGILFGKQNDFYHRAEFAAGVIEESCGK